MSELPYYQYSYHLPESLIAKRPAEPRDSARLFVYDTRRDEITLYRFSALGDHLPKDSLLVLNDTKVVPARAMLKKETGGKIEVLFLVNEWKREGPIPALVDRKIGVGAKIFFGPERILSVARQEENIFWLEPNFSARELFALLDKRGVTPLPKYIKHSDLREAVLRKKYQSVFGKRSASVAAPTASLHFTQRLLHKLERQGFSKAFVTLDVGLGTFAPVSEENMAKGTLHTEFLTISPGSATLIREHHDAKKPVVAVGTTVVRTLESESQKILSRAKRGTIVDKTRIFIHPPHAFRIVDAMVTNFHLPDTSLMMLVQAFLAQKNSKRTLLDLYQMAIEEKFRFYSFGDAMFIK